MYRIQIRGDQLRERIRKRFRLEHTIHEGTCTSRWLYSTVQYTVKYGEVQCGHVLTSGLAVGRRTAKRPDRGARGSKWNGTGRNGGPRRSASRLTTSKSGTSALHTPYATRHTRHDEVPFAALHCPVSAARRGAKVEYTSTIERMCALIHCDSCCWQSMRSATVTDCTVLVYCIIYTEYGPPLQPLLAELKYGARVVRALKFRRRCGVIN